MDYLLIAQYMSAAAFLTIALTHFVIWLRVRQETLHVLFAMSAACAGFNATAEAGMYRADSIESMNSALRWYVTTSGLWGITTVVFLVSYAKVGRLGKTVAAIIVTAFVLALTINLFSPASYLYTEVTGLREMTLPWGEQFRLAIGDDNPWRILTELPMFAVFLLVGDGVFQLIRRGERDRAWIFGATATIFLGLFATHAFLVDTGRIDFPYLSTYGFLLLVALMSYDLAGEVLRQWDLSVRLKQTETELETAVADERDRIAAELHDSVTQTLFSTAAIADALPKVWSRDPQQGAQGLQDLRHLTRSALAEMRTLLLELHPASLLEKDLGTLLQQLADATAGRTRMGINVDVHSERSLPDDVKIALYRVAQESLNNVVKHSGARHVSLTLTENGAGLEFGIRDDGRGFDPDDDPSGMGLGLMRQRVESINGQLQIETVIGQGTVVRVHWPSNLEENGGL